MGSFIKNNYNNMNKPDKIIIHHSGGTNADPLADTSHHTFEIIENYHVSKGWGEIGYNWLIEKDGSIHKGRSEEGYGAHTLGQNGKSIGICVVGNFDFSLPTKKQEESLVIVYKDILTRYPNLRGQVFPHRAFSNKSCYGDKLSDDWAKNLVEGEVPEVPDNKCEEKTEEIKELKKKVGLLTMILESLVKLLTKLKLMKK
jgi:hypothetical protein